MEWADRQLPEANPAAEMQPPLFPRSPCCSEKRALEAAPLTEEVVDALLNRLPRSCLLSKMALIFWKMLSLVLLSVGDVDGFTSAGAGDEVVEETEEEEAKS